MNPTLTTFSDGSQAWWLHGKRHREDGPAVIYLDGYQAWYLHGQLHREDGPAVIWPDGSQEWWLDGVQVSAEEGFSKMTKERKMKAIFNLDEWR